MPSINNFLQGFQDGLPAMKDYQHASRLYIDNNHKLMPKQKFLFHVVFNTDETLFVDGFSAHERYELNMLVKACDLPKYDMSMEEKVQYNKKMYTATSTNAHFLNDKNAKATIESGLSRLTISIDGTTQETYESYRKNGSLDKVLEG